MERRFSRARIREAVKDATDKVALIEGVQVEFDQLFHGMGGGTATVLTDGRPKYTTADDAALVYWNPVGNEFNVRQATSDAQSQKVHAYAQRIGGAIAELKKGSGNGWQPHPIMQHIFRYRGSQRTMYTVKAPFFDGLGPLGMIVSARSTQQEAELILSRRAIRSSRL